MKTKSKKANSKIVEKNNFYTKYKGYIPTVIVLILVIGILIYLAAVRQDTIAGEAIKMTTTSVVEEVTNVNTNDLSVLIIPKEGYSILEDGSIKINDDNLNKICICSGCDYDCSCSNGCEAGCPSCK